MKLKPIFLILTVFSLLISCKTGYEDHILDLDSQGRKLSVLITTPNKLTITHLESFFIQGQAFDKVGISKVEIKVNNNPYSLVNKEQGWAYWNQTVSLESGKNRVCAKVTNTAKQSRENCVQINRSFEVLEELKKPYGEIETFGVRLGKCVSYKARIYCLGGEFAGAYYIHFFNSYYDLNEKKWYNDKQIQQRTSFAITLVDESIYLLTGSMWAEDYLKIRTDIYYERNYKLKLNNSDDWEETLFNLTKRHRASAVSINKKIFIVGGLFQDGNILQHLKSIEYIDTSISDDTNPDYGWKNGPELNFERAAFLAVSYNNRYIYVIGGHDKNFKAVSAIEMLDTENLNEGWVVISQMPHPRYFMYGGLIKNKYIFAIAGKDSNGYSSIIERYDLNKNEWNMINSNISDKFMKIQAGFAVNNNSIYVLGGLDNKGDKSFEFFKYQPVLD